jgi:hypothetical protein
VAFDLGIVEEAGQKWVSEGVVGGQAGLVDALLEVKALLPLLLQNCPSQHITAINCEKVVYASFLHFLSLPSHLLLLRSRSSLALYRSCPSRRASS